MSPKSKEEICRRLESICHERLHTIVTSPEELHSVDETAWRDRLTEEHRILLRTYADRYGLARSGASDFHGFDEKETLCNCFPYELYEDILGRKCRLDASRRDKNGLYDMSDIIEDKDE